MRTTLQLLLGVWLALGGLFAPAHAAGNDGEQAAWTALRAGAIVLFRHADAPGGGDPAHFRLGDCATQRNLGDAGRVQSRRIGETVRAQQVPVGKVLASQWCRTRDTAELAFPGQVQADPAFNSFFQERGREAEQTRQAKSLLLGWNGPGALVVVTHQVNITALTGIFPASGEGIVLRRKKGDDTLEVVGRVLP